MITIYSKPDCGKCEQTRRLLEKEGLACTMIDVTQDANAAARLHSLGVKALPYVVTDHDTWTDFRLDKIQATIAMKGHNE